MIARIKPFLCLLALLFILSAASCSTPLLKGLSNAEPETDSAYGDFNDILIPSALKKDTQRSFIYESQGFKAGTLFYNGYVDVDSLVDFFSQGMQRDGWQLRSTFRYPEMLLLFEKSGRVCIIMVGEGTVMTHVSIRVAPAS